MRDSGMDCNGRGRGNRMFVALSSPLDPLAPGGFTTTHLSGITCPRSGRASTSGTGPVVSNGHACQELLRLPCPMGRGNRPPVTLRLQSHHVQLRITEPARRLTRRDQACDWTRSRHRREMEISRLMRPDVGRVCVKLGLRRLEPTSGNLIGSGSRSRTGTGSGRDALCNDLRCAR